jgi:hypothetical protein
MKLREMVARVLALHLRDELDPEAILVDGVQTKIPF